MKNIVMVVFCVTLFLLVGCGSQLEVADPLYRIAETQPPPIPVDGKNGRDGNNGRDGTDGELGSPGERGERGPSGRRGEKGDAGEDGEDGISVVDAKFDASGDLIITLSNGDTINAGKPIAQNNIVMMPPNPTSHTNTTTVVYASPTNASSPDDFIIEGTVLAGYTGTAKKVIIPEGITEIKDNVFRENTFLTNVVFPSSLSIVGEMAFYDCRNLQSVSANEGLQIIEPGAFSACRKLKSFSIPSSLKYFGCNPFTGNTGGVNGVFGNSGIIDIALPEGLLEVGHTALYEYLGSRFEFPDSVVKIYPHVFDRFYQSNLKSIKIGSKLQFIGEGLLRDNGSCTQITIATIVPPTFISLPNGTTGGRLYNMYSPIPPDLKIYVPAASVNAYKTHPHWGQYASHIFPII